MPKIKGENPIFKKSNIPVLGVVLLILLALGLLFYNNANSTQAIPAIAAKVKFDGEYRIGDGEWREYKEGVHISSTKGDVTFKGVFQLYSQEGQYFGAFDGGVPLGFYADHIGLTFIEEGLEPFVVDAENRMYGPSSCGIIWSAYSYFGDASKPIEIIVHNPHSFGNENAIDEMMSRVSIWGDLEFERGILESGKNQRATGLFFIIVAFVLLGSALFSALVHIKNSRTIWLLGLTTLAAGLYLLYTAPGVFFWNDSNTTNTTVLGISMMFYMLFVSGIITGILRRMQKLSRITLIVLGCAIAVLIIIPMVSDIYYYDTWLPWVIIQSLANAVFLACMITEYIYSDKKNRWGYIGMALLLISFEVDVVATYIGIWEGGFISKYIFFVLFVVSMFIVLRLIPESINAAEKARELELQKSHLEAELKESRISIMLSQIQPHFIYNTLGTIERMCLKDPEKAFDLVRNFSLYLRGNFSELDSIAPIRFTEELKHVEYYVNIEKVRFPDMSIEYNVEAKDFVLPALSVQPLVENAIKHGLMRLEEGGTVVISSYETKTHFCVEVRDDGVGFDTGAPIEEKKHVGLRNIQGRLKAMVNGELILESKPGEGTKAVIVIPKEVTE